MYATSGSIRPSAQPLTDSSPNNLVFCIFFVCFLAHRGSNVGLLLLQYSRGVVRHPMDHQVSAATRCFCRVFIFVSSNL